MNYKNILQSKTFWAVVMNMLLKIVGLFFVVEVDDQTMSLVVDMAVGLSTFLVSFVVDALILYGRVKATTKISIRKK